MKITISAAVACVLALPAWAAAQNYPVKPIRVIVSVPAGGTPDVVARSVTPSMSTLLGQQLVLDNRGGAGCRIAAETVATAAPDGYVAQEFEMVLRADFEKNGAAVKRASAKID